MRAISLLSNSSCLDSVSRVEILSTCSCLSSEPYRAGSRGRGVILICCSSNIVSRSLWISSRSETTASSLACLSFSWARVDSRVSGGRIQHKLVQLVQWLFDETLPLKQNLYPLLADQTSLHKIDDDFIHQRKLGWPELILEIVCDDLGVGSLPQIFLNSCLLLYKTNTAHTHCKGLIMEVGGCKLFDISSVFNTLNSMESSLL